jgi:GTPase SAR1 family protein
MAPMYYRDSVAAVVVYDVTNPDSFDAVPDWIKGAIDAFLCCL